LELGSVVSLMSTKPLLNTEYWVGIACWC